MLLSNSTITNKYIKKNSPLEGHIFSCCIVYYSRISGRHISVYRVVLWLFLIQYLFTILYMERSTIENTFNRAYIFLPLSQLQQNQFHRRGCIWPLVHICHQTSILRKLHWALSVIGGESQAFPECDLSDAWEKCPLKCNGSYRSAFFLATECRSSFDNHLKYKQSD